MRKVTWVSISLAAGIAAMGFFSCGNGKPCSGSSCLINGKYDISGEYEVVITPRITCALWSADAQPSSLMLVTADDQGGASVTLNPGLAQNPHVLTGNEYTSGQISVSENLNPQLGIPNSQLNGSFSEGGQGLQFTGTLVLTQVTQPGSTSGAGAIGGTGAGAGAGAIGGGTAGNPCSATYSLQASIQATGVTTTGASSGSVGSIGTTGSNGSIGSIGSSGSIGGTTGSSGSIG